jgi:hypothetical protein
LQDIDRLFQADFVVPAHIRFLVDRCRGLIGGHELEGDDGIGQGDLDLRNLLIVDVKYVLDLFMAFIPCKDMMVVKLPGRLPP